MRTRWLGILYENGSWNWVEMGPSASHGHLCREVSMLSGTHRLMKRFPRDIEGLFLSRAQTVFLR